MKYADLFCGLGAFHTAFNNVSKEKYECVYACDINPQIRKLYFQNYGIEPDSDITKIESISRIPDFDILCAGFPCQTFSIAGKKKAFDSEKGKLFFKILEIIDIKKPKIIFLENVKNLTTINNGETFNLIIKELKDRNYNVNYKVLDSKYYNSPQSRQRVYIVCSLNYNYEFKSIKNKLVPVSTIIDTTNTDFFDYTLKYKLEECNGKGSMIYKLINLKTGKGGRQGERVYSINSYGPTICASSGGPGAKTGLYLIPDSSISQETRMRFVGTCNAPSGCKATLESLRDSLKIRTLNVKETLKMFGFNEDYIYSNIVTENQMLFFLGNSIVVNVLEEIIKNIY